MRALRHSSAGKLAVRALCALAGARKHFSTSYDVVIAGGGVMGCSSAYFLAKRMPGSSICIVERDPNVS